MSDPDDTLPTVPRPPTAPRALEPSPALPPTTQQALEARTARLANPNLPITPQHEEIFVIEYIRTGRNHELAADRIGLPHDRIAAFMRRPNVQQALRIFTNAQVTALDVTKDRVIQEIAAIAFVDPARAIDPASGELLPVDQLDPDTRRAVTNLKHATNYRIDANLKLKALEVLARTTGALAPATVQTNVQVNLDTIPLEVLEQIARAQQPPPKTPDTLVIEPAPTEEE